MPIEIGACGTSRATLLVDSGSEAGMTAHFYRHPGLDPGSIGNGARIHNGRIVAIDSSSKAGMTKHSFEHRVNSI